MTKRSSFALANLLNTSKNPKKVQVGVQEDDEEFCKK